MCMQCKKQIRIHHKFRLVKNPLTKEMVGYMHNNCEKPDSYDRYFPPLVTEVEPVENAPKQES